MYVLAVWADGSAPYLGALWPLLRPMRRSRLNTASTASRWKPSVQLDRVGRVHLADNELGGRVKISIADMAIWALVWSAGSGRLL